MTIYANFKGCEELVGRIMDQLNRAEINATITYDDYLDEYDMLIDSYGNKERFNILSLRYDKNTKKYQILFKKKMFIIHPEDVTIEFDRDKVNSIAITNI